MSESRRGFIKKAVGLAAFSGSGIGSAASYLPRDRGLDSEWAELCLKSDRNQQL